MSVGLGFVLPAWSQVVTDGTMGAAGGVTGPNYTIGSNLGTVRGGNLFHSFERFSIRHGETATFTGPGSIQNVISRVTGGDVSKINGTLRSDIAGANVFLINPAGVVFGAGSQVDVSGAFVVSTADELRLADGGVFAVSDPSDTVLTTAAPSAFGFLASNRGGVAVDGTIAGADDKAVTIAAHSVQLRGGKITSTGGSVDLAAVGGAGTVGLNALNGVRPGSTANGEVYARSGAEVHAQGAGSRAVIRGGRVTLDDARVISTDAFGGGIAIEAADDLVLRDGGRIETEAVDDVGGHVRVRAGDVLVNGATSLFPTGFVTRAYGSGDGGNIQIDAATIRLVDGGQVISSTVGDGYGGNLSLEAEQFVATGRSLAGAAGGLFTSTIGDAIWGDGGDIRLFANQGFLRNGAVIGTTSLSNGLGGSIVLEGGQLDIRNGGIVQATTRGSGPGGPVRIRLRGQLSIVGTGDVTGPDAAPTGIRTDSGQFTPILSLIENTGAIDINAGSVYIAQAGGISLTTLGLNSLGDMRIRAQTVTLEGYGSGLFVNSQSAYAVTGDPNQATSGDAGNIKVEAKLLEVLDQATITASTSGTGAGGNIVVRVSDLLIDGSEANGATGTGITASTLLPVIAGRPDIVGGDAGSILIDVNETMIVRNGGGVSVFTRGGGDGGDLVARAGRLEMFNTPDFLRDAEVFAPAILEATTESRDDGAGRAGAIAVRSADIFIGPGTRLTAGTFGPGLGGVVHLSSTGNLVIDGQGFDPQPTIDVSYGSVSGQGESGNLILWAANDLIIRDASITATAVSGDGGYVAIGTTRPDAPYRVKRQKLTPRRLMIEDSSVEAESALGDGGWVLLHAEELVSVRHGRVAASARGRGGRIDIDPEVVVIDDVEVFARAELLEGGDISVRGGTYLRSPDSIFDVTSQSGLDGSVSEAAQLDLSGTLLPLLVDLGDDMAQLFEQCTVKLGQGISSFIVVGRGGLPVEPGLWLPAYAAPAVDRAPVGAAE